MDNIQKVNENTISVEKIVPEKVEVVHYQYEFLLKERETAKARLEELEELITQAEKLGIKTND